MRFRILILLMFGCAVLFVVKTLDIINNQNNMSQLMFVQTLNAQESENEDGGGDEEGDGEEGGGSDGEEAADKAQEEEELLINEDKRSFQGTELEILKRLGKRRDVLEQWENDLKIKEDVLAITQNKIDNKITELRKLKKEVENVLQEYENKENKKTKSLVKIYESMKPAAAALIFTELDMDTLLKIVDNMKEAKAALVLAKMRPKLAKELTLRFSQRGRLSEDNVQN